jgi:hypothetical protein
MLTALAMVAIMTAGASDATGRWTGTLNVATAPDAQSGKLILVLKQSGATVTGTAGTDDAHQSGFRNGRAHGDTLEFDVQWGNTAHFTLIQHGDAMTGEMHGDPKEAPRGKTPAVLLVSLKRATP